MARKKSPNLTEAELRLIDVVWEKDEATVSEVAEALPRELGLAYNTVLTTMRILEEKGHTQHEQDGPRYVYRPSIGRDRASVSALRHLVRTFFDGSREQVVAALLDDSTSQLSDEELDRLSRLIDRARQEGA